MHTMPRGKPRPTLEEVKALLADDRDFLRPLVLLQERLVAEDDRNRREPQQQISAGGR
jgi:hypothetical protein